MIHFAHYDKMKSFYNGWLACRYSSGKPATIQGAIYFEDAGGMMAALSFCPAYEPVRPMEYHNVLGIKGTATWDEIKPVLLDHLAEINPRDFGRFAKSEQACASVREWEAFVVSIKESECK